jgi:hypothetical protein
MARDARRRVSVDAALRRGQWTVNGPVHALMWGPVGVAAFLAALNGADVKTAMCWGAVGFVVGWPLAWLSWSIQVPRWKVWAWARVEDLDELKARAVAGKLIWPDGHLFGRTEIWTPSLRRRMSEIEQARSSSTDYR